MLPRSTDRRLVSLSPSKTIHSNIGYRISSVNGSQFFNDARAVNGSLVSTYQSPFVNLAWTVHPGLIWKAEYNFYGYGEGGPSGAPILQHVNFAHIGRCPLRLFLGTDRFDRIAFWSDRAQKLPRE